MLIDRYMPKYDEGEHHEIEIDAPPDRAYRAVREVNLAASLPITLLFAIRGLPHLVTGKAKLSRRITLDSLLDLGFVVLEEEPGAELVLGVVGRFWELDSGIRRVAAGDFVGFDEPGFAKAVMNFAVSERGDGSTRVVTETRIWSTDDGARRRFGIYWKVVGPFSALIRRFILNLIKREAQRPAHARDPVAGL